MPKLHLANVPLIVKNREHMLSHDLQLHHLLRPFITWGNTSFEVPALYLMLEIKLNDDTILQDTSEYCRRLYAYEYTTPCRKPTHTPHLQCSMSPHMMHLENRYLRIWYELFQNTVRLSIKGCNEDENQSPTFSMDSTWQCPWLIHTISSKYFKSVINGSWFMDNSNSSFFGNFHGQHFENVQHGSMYSHIFSDNIIVIGIYIKCLLLKTIGSGREWRAVVDRAWWNRVKSLEGR